MPADRSASRPAAGLQRSDRFVMGGAVVFVLGLMLLALVMVLWSSGRDVPGLLAATPLLCPVGFAVSFWGLVLQARERRGRSDVDRQVPQP